MKKVFKALATTAVLASIIPLKGSSDENGGSLEGLLWKATWAPKADDPAKKDINITFGFNNPFPTKPEPEEEIFADEVTVDYAPQSDEDAVTEDDFCDEELCCDENGCCIIRPVKKAVEEVVEEVAEEAEDAIEIVIETTEEVVKEMTEAVEVVAEEIAEEASEDKSETDPE